MKKSVLVLMPIMLAPTLAFSAEITPQTLRGDYTIDASFLNNKARFILNVRTATAFDAKKIKKDGSESKTCSGTYVLANETSPSDSFGGTDKVFKGTLSCPDDPQKTADVMLNFRNLQTGDLEKGASVAFRSSLAYGITLNVKMKKQ